jgi:hypothetical protein
LEAPLASWPSRVARSDGTKIGLNYATLALTGGHLDLQVGQHLRLDRDLVSKARRSSCAARLHDLPGV